MGADIENKPAVQTEALLPDEERRCFLQKKRIFLKKTLAIGGGIV